MMVAINDPVWVALISSVPATLVGAGALITAIRLRKPIGQINDAVNHRAPGEPKLLQIALDTNERLGRFDDKLDRMEDKLDSHLKWHAGIELVDVDEVFEIAEAVRDGA